jgi:pantoate--beta-alanine ligase
MMIWRSAETFRQACDEARRRGERVALVPTMGALHAGHQTLVTEARKHASFVAVSVFVNPTQFGPNEDFSRYPRDLDGDVAKSVAAGAHGVFAPPANEMYPPGDETRVHVGDLAKELCGPHRPGHFEGVATVVAKLLILTGPARAFFGRKDYQQLKVIQRIVKDLFIPVEVVGVPTIREADGLAMSSRNAYLSKTTRKDAVGIPRGLTNAAHAFNAGERRVSELVRLVRARVEGIAQSIDYISAADPETLRVFDSNANAPNRTLLALAIRVQGARLIDNMVLGEDPAPISDQEKQGGSADA